MKGYIYDSVLLNLIFFSGLNKGAGSFESIAGSCYADPARGRL
jgi:hypothetical protein